MPPRISGESAAVTERKRAKASSGLNSRDLAGPNGAAHARKVRAVELSSLKQSRDFDVVASNALGTRDQKVCVIDLVLEGAAGVVAQYLKALGPRSEELCPIVSAVLAGAGFSSSYKHVARVLSNLEEEAAIDSRRSNGWITTMGGPVVAGRRIVEAAVPQDYARSASQMALARSLCPDQIDAELQSRNLRCGDLDTFCRALEGTSIYRRFQRGERGAEWLTRRRAIQGSGGPPGDGEAGSANVLDLILRFAIPLMNRDAHKLPSGEPYPIDDSLWWDVLDQSKRDPNLAGLRAAMRAYLDRRGIKVKRLTLSGDILRVKAVRPKGTSEDDAVEIVRQAMLPALRATQG